MKERLVPEVVGYRANAAELKDMPYRRLHDMAIVYRFLIESGDDSIATMRINNRLMEYMGVSEEELYADALEYGPKIRPMEIMSLADMLKDLTNMSLDMSGGAPLFVATVESRVRGAGIIVYEDFCKAAADVCGGSFYLLPSSIHEVILVPDTGEWDAEVLLSMVSEINATLVAENERLTDNVYHYPAQNTPCNRFEAVVSF